METDSKPKKKRRRRRMHPLLKLLIAIALGIGTYYFLSSAYFDVQKIAVENNRHYTKEQIISRAEAKTGQNIFGAETRAMKERLLKDPYIKNAVVKRTLPGTIVIHVEERKEAAAIPYADRFIIIDEDGLVLRKSEKEPTLTLLVGMTIKTMEDGAALEVEETAVLTATLSLLHTMTDAELYFKKIDMSGVTVKAYIYDQLLCKGVPEHVAEGVRSGELKEVLIRLYTDGIERGTINVGRDQYYAFSPMVQ